jgi:dTMP kinase
LTSSRGRFITLEGGEGTGKSTQARLLVSALTERGIKASATREPGGAPGAEEIRQLLVTGERGRWDPVSEMLLHFAARREHLVRTVWPALERGEWVVSDRFADSTRAYQGYGLGIALEAVELCYTLAVGDFVPDLTFILDLDPATGVDRANARKGEENRYENMDLAFHGRVREGFLAIARGDPQRCVVLPASGDVDAVHRTILVAVEHRFGTSDERARMPLDR